jgi:hypothetical protein
VSESTTASGKRSLRMRSKRTRNCSRAILPAARGESVCRNSRRPGFVRPNLDRFDQSAIIPKSGQLHLWMDTVDSIPREYVRA